MSHINKKRHVASNGKDWCNYISKIILHKCLICGKPIVNDKAFVDYHMRRSHHHSVGIYIEKRSEERRGGKGGCGRGRCRGAEGR